VVFSSNLFLFFFLPSFLVIYFLASSRQRNLVLCLASLGFYFWGAGWVVLLLLVGLLVNYHLGRLVIGRRWVLWPGVALNLSYLFYFKYYPFFHAELSRLADWCGWRIEPAEQILLPIGISLFVFQAISYLVDCYVGKHPPAPSFLEFCTYLTAFPHVIAGPIVRYDHIRTELPRRRVDVDLFFRGIWRFSLGLAKKTLLANPLGAVADHIMGRTPLAELSIGVAWLGALCYTFQIYYDFSGYSDMAIGLGRMLGFTFPENFDQPYRAASVTEFWRRWHMTLSSWFRDYVYIPLGGSRLGPWRTCINLACVFVLTGLWHGAAWSFIFWGCFHGMLLITERALRSRFDFQASGPLGVAVTFVLVMFGWVFFRLTSIQHALDYCGVMLGLRRPTAVEVFGLSYYLEVRTLTFLALGFFFALFPFEQAARALRDCKGKVAMQGAVIMGLLLMAATSLSIRGFNPFIYFRF
jgi:alginate O-acetyltransferase complex protein AlgI